MWVCAKESERGWYREWDEGIRWKEERRVVPRASICSFAFNIEIVESYADVTKCSNYLWEWRKRGMRVPGSEPFSLDSQRYPRFILNHYACCRGRTFYMNDYIQLNVWLVTYYSVDILCRNISFSFSSSMLLFTYLRYYEGKIYYRPIINIIELTQQHEAIYA